MAKSAEFNQLIQRIQEDHPVMEEKELRECIRKYRETGDTSFRDRVVLSNAGLALKYANFYEKMSASLDIEDLFNEAISGIILAVDKFDLAFENKFSTYAVYWLKQKITRTISEKGGTIRVPVHIRDHIRKARAYLAEQEAKGISEVTAKELSENLNVSIDIAELILNTDLNVLSLNATTSGDEDRPIEMMDMVPDTMDLESEIEKKEMMEVLRNTMKSKLTSKEFDILSKRFGLNGEPILTLREIGMEYHVTRERIRQIELIALKKLKCCPEIRHIKYDFLGFSKK